jgi:EAL domain-containing protein (putative c-di-GMP-specific phosphodiesterase class I)
VARLRDEPPAGAVGTIADPGLGRLERDLLTAFGPDQFRLVYQPIFALAPLHMTGLEALLRWRHPTLGEVPARQFLPLLERTGRLLELSAWVLHEACREVARWRVGGHALELAVNLAGIQVATAGVEQVAAGLAESGLEPGALIVDVPVSVAADGLVRPALAELAGLGVRLALAEVTGKGPLPTVGAQVVKLSRQLVQGGADVRPIVRRCAQRQIRTVAVGIEEPEQVVRMIDAGVDAAQGHLLARPLERNALDDYLAAAKRNREAAHRARR